jgi:hypothetical protein
MSQKHKQTTSAFLSWIVGNLLGWIFISALIVTLPILKSIPSFVAPLLILTIPFGLAQWLVLRRFIPLTLLWVFTILIGWLLSYLIFAAIPESLWPFVDDEATATLTFMFTVVGAAMGLPQWLILRRKLTKAVLWILGSSLGVGLGFGLVLATDLINQSEFISYTVVVLVYGIATGSTLAWLLNHKAQTHNQRFSATEQLATVRVPVKALDGESFIGKVIDMEPKLRSRYGCMALAAGLLLACIVSLAVFPSLRLAAVELLEIVSGRWESAVYKAYPTSENPQDFYGRVYTKTRIEAIRENTLTSQEEASQFAGFRVLMPTHLPDGMEPITQIGVGEHAYRVEVNFEAARALLQAADLPTDAIPAGQAHVQVTAAIEPGVVMHQSQGVQWFTILQGRNPQVTVPEGFDLDLLRELGELGLRYLGLSPVEARQLNQRMEWASFLVLPPADMTMAEPASINGRIGYVLRSTEPGKDHTAVLWEADGVLYGIYGGLPKDELVAIAESLKSAR